MNIPGRENSTCTGPETGGGGQPSRKYIWFAIAGSCMIERRERQECGQALKITNGKWEREEQDACSSSLSIPSPISSTWPVCKEIKLYPKMNGPDCFVYLGEGFFTWFSNFLPKGTAWGADSRLHLNSCLWQETSASGPLLNGECQP